MPVKAVLPYINFDELTAQQRSELKTRFEARKKELEEAMASIDQALSSLTGKAPTQKSKKTVKKKAGSKR
jgi:hypothetical protein